MRVIRVKWPDPAIWAEAAPMIAKAVARTDHETLDAVVAEIDAGRAQLWIVTDGEIRAAIVTRAVETKDGPAVEYWHVGGTRAREWFSLMTATIEAAARRSGFVKMTTGCRLGWQRLAKDYRPVAVKLEKRL